MAEKEVEELCIKTQALIDNLDEQDSKYEEIFLNQLLLIVLKR